MHITKHLKKFFSGCKRARISDKKRRGAMSIEMMGVIAVIGMFLTFAAQQADQTRETARAAGFAQQLNMAAKAGQNYLDANAASLLAELSGATPKPYLVVEQDRITDNLGQELPDMTGDSARGLERYMPVSFNSTRYGQRVRMHVYKGADGAIHALVGTYGGEPAEGNFQNTKAYPRYMSVARQAASMNGFGIMTEKNVAGSQTINRVVGPGGTWEFIPEDADYGNIPLGDFQDGQLARPLYAYSATVKDDLLYRTEIEGHPELNAMQTDFHMNGYQITDTGTITISQRPQIMGTDPVEYGDPAPGGNGLVIQPYLTDGAAIHDEAQKVCDAGQYNKPDGHIFTMSRRLDGAGDGGTNPDGTSNPHGQADDDLNGIWICLHGQARLISDSQNSSPVKGVSIKRHGETIAKPRCPLGTKPAIYVMPAAFAPVNNTTDLPAPLTALQALAEDYPTEWKIVMRMKHQKHEAGGGGNWFTPTAASGAFNYAVVQTACERDNDAEEINKGAAF